MKRALILLIVLYLIFGIVFYVQYLRFSRLAIHVGGDIPQIVLVEELPTAVTMIFFWPFLMLGQAVS
jgi:hypothetical protein